VPLKNKKNKREIPHPFIPILDAARLAEFKYQLSISWRIAEQRFDEIMGDTSEWAKKIAREWIERSKKDKDWWWKE